MNVATCCFSSSLKPFFNVLRTAKRERKEMTKYPIRVVQFSTQKKNKNIHAIINDQHTHKTMLLKEL